jgi:hypothetical protein
MGDFDVDRTILLYVYAFALGAVELEIEGGYGWAERLPTWWLRRGIIGRVFDVFMGHRPLTGYHVYAFTIPLLLLHLPFTVGVDWSLSAELVVLGTYFVFASVWDYHWFILSPAYTVRRFKRGNVWWFEVPWIWRFPLDYYVSIVVSIAFAALAAWADGDSDPLVQHMWMLAGFAVLTGLAVLAAPLYHRWYRHMRRTGADDRDKVRTYPPPDPEQVWSGGVPDMHPLDQVPMDRGNERGSGRDR